MIRTGIISLFLVAKLTTAAVAQSPNCPSPPDISDDMDALFSLVQRAGSAREARPVVNGMWHLWTRAPDAHSQTMLDQGRESIRVADHEKADQILSDLIAYCPDYAEGYNQRAYSRFLRGHFETALADLDQTLDLDPRHVAALSGRFLTLHALGQTEAAQKTLRAALALNPWLPERFMLAKPKGTAL